MSEKRVYMLKGHQVTSPGYGVLTYHGDRFYNVDSKLADELIAAGVASDGPPEAAAPIAVAEVAAPRRSTVDEFAHPEPAPDHESDTLHDDRKGSGQ